MPRPHGRTFVVTGGSSGLGRATAERLSRMRANVVAVVRREDEVREVRAAIAGATGRGTVEVVAGDLSSRTSVEEVGREIRERFPEIHGLLHCAGVRLPDRRLGPDHTEVMFAVEYLAPFLLTRCLIDPLAAGAPSRVVVVAGEEHRKGFRAPRGLDLKNLQGERQFSVLAHGKHLALARILFVQELGRRLEGTGIGVLAVAPGPTRTSLLRHYPWHLQMLERASLLVRGAQAPEEAADHLLHAATDPELAGVSGKYLLEGREVVPSPAARDPEMARKLWELTEELLGERFVGEDLPDGEPS